MKLHWEGDRLVNETGQVVARHWPYGPKTEWVVYTAIDPQDNTRGTSRSPSAASKAVEKAVAKFGHTVES